MNRDFQIEGKYGRADRRTDLVYFGANSAVLDQAETAKLWQFAETNATADLELSAFGSDEEGEADSSKKELLGARLRRVVTVLRQSGWTGRDYCTSSEVNAEPEIEYREVRRVQLKRRGTTIVGDLAQPAHQPAPPAVAAAFERALTLLGEAQLAIGTGAADTALERYFPGVAADTVRDTLGNITDLLTSLQEADPDHPGLRPAYRYYARNCGEANTSRSGKDTLMTVGAPLFTKTQVKQAATLIHEGSHAATGVRTDDIAYTWQRLIGELPGRAALRNADSIMVFVLTATGNGASASRPTEDDLDVAFTGQERAAVRQALAYLEGYLVLARQDIRRIYRCAWQTNHNDAAWDTGYTALMQVIRAAFSGVVTCPPDKTDDWYLAGIFDRVTDLSNAVRERRLQVYLAGKTRQTSWKREQAGPGSELAVSPDWLTMSLRDRVRALLDALIAVTPSIPRDWEQAYRTVILGMADTGRYASV